MSVYGKERAAKSKDMEMVRGEQGEQGGGGVGGWRQSGAERRRTVDGFEESRGSREILIQMLYVRTGAIPFIEEW